jgi:ankyrin repeat protein
MNQVNADLLTTIVRFGILDQLRMTVEVYNVHIDPADLIEAYLNDKRDMLEYLYDRIRDMAPINDLLHIIIYSMENNYGPFMVQNLLRLVSDHMRELVNMKTHDELSIPYWVVHNNDTETLTRLLPFGLNINLRNDRATNNTLLHDAAVIGSLEVVRFLLENGADGTLVNYQNETAERVAVENENYDVAEFINAYLQEDIKDPGEDY